MDFELGVTQKENRLVNKAKNKEATKNNLSNLEFEKPFCSRIIISLSEHTLPITSTMLRKKLNGIISSMNSGNLNNTTQKTSSKLNSPLDTCSRYWIDLEARITSRKTKPTAHVCEKISFNK